MTAKRQRSLDARKKRSVTTGVSADEHEAVRAYCEAHGMTISGLMHEVIEAASAESGSAAQAATKYLAGWLDIEEIEATAELAQAAGMEPIAGLRLMALARAGVGSGAVLVRQLTALGIVRLNAPRSPRPRKPESSARARPAKAR